MTGAGGRDASMTQNRSHAVMSQRVEARDSLDLFPTPCWATRALCEWLLEVCYVLETSSVWEPACGLGDMVKPLREYFGECRASDVFDHWGGYGREIVDFLMPNPEREFDYDFIATNPPFRLGEQFALTALSRAKRGVALLVRTAFLESAERHNNLFLPHPPSDILQFVERVPMFKGRLDRAGSTATAYCWLVWLKRIKGGQTQFHWIAPCRRRLERDSDYPIARAAE